MIVLNSYYSMITTNEELYIIFSSQSILKIISFMKNANINI